MQISAMNFLEMMTDRVKITIVIIIANHIGTFDGQNRIWPWPILELKVKVMQISKMIILEMVTDKEKIAIAIK